jgi:hypothetical protein
VVPYSLTNQEHKEAELKKLAPGRFPRRKLPGNISEPSGGWPQGPLADDPILASWIRTTYANFFVNKRGVSVSASGFTTPSRRESKKPRPSPTSYASAVMTTPAVQPEVGSPGYLGRSLSFSGSSPNIQEAVVPITNTHQAQAYSKLLNKVS